MKVDSTGSRKKILVMSRQFPPEVGGAGTYAQNIALALTGAGHRVSVLSVTARDRQIAERTSDQTLLDRGIESIRRIPFVPKLYLPLLSMAGRKAMRSGEYDAVILADIGAQKALSLFPSLFPSPDQRFGGIPIWTVFHGSEIYRYFDQQSVLFRVFGGQKRMIRFLESVTGCIAISDFLRQTIVAKLPFLENKTFTIRHGIDVDDFSSVLALSKTQVRRTLGLDSSKKIILTAGRLLRSKGQDTLIREFPRICQKCPDAQLVVIGDGPDEGYLRDLIKKLELEERVLLLQGVPNSEMKMYYRAADLFVQLSRISGESFGLVYVEANACGVPVIASSVGGVPEAVADGVSGRLVNSSESQLAECILSMLLDDTLRATMSKSGLERAQREFSLRSMASNTEQLLFEAAAEQ